MRYLITTTNAENNEPFKTNYYDYENNFDELLGMIVYDLFNDKYTTDGKKWKPIEIDHL